MCFEVFNGEDFEVSFTATRGWTFVSSEYWIGESIDDIPVDEDDSLDIEKFPYFWCNSTGLSTVKEFVEMKWSYNCEDLGTFDLKVLAHFTMAQLQDDGTIAPDTELVAFAEEYRGHTSDGGSYGWFDFVIDCDCPPIATAGAGCESEIVLLDEDFEAEENEESWHEGFEYSWSGGITSESALMSHFLGRLGQGKEEVSQSFDIPLSGDVSADRVTLEFTLYQIDRWTSEDDAFLVMIGTSNGTQISLGDMSMDTESQYLEEDVDGVSWYRNMTVSGVNLGFLEDHDAKHFVHIDIPASKFASAGALEITFRAVTSLDIDEQSAGIDDIKVTAHYSGCDQEGARQLEDNCHRVSPLAQEDYESGVDLGWTNGLISHDSELGHFLGRFGEENPRASKVFTEVPTDADLVTVDFKLYEFGIWDPSDDRLLLTIGSTDVDVLGGAHPSGSLNGIVWSRRALKEEEEEGGQYAISLTLPSHVYVSGKLRLSFWFDLSGSIGVKSGGIDDLSIAAHYDLCDGDGVGSGMPLHVESTHFGMANFNHKKKTEQQQQQQQQDKENKLVSERGAEEEGGPLEEGEDGPAEGPLCSASDFPCGEEGKVYVCHYSVFKGYSTFCVKEEDTDIIRFYPNDYCGPCTGGYGNTLKQANPEE
eukprot:Sro520_g159160.1 n/a (648) ;mRNA; r:33775-35718